MTTSSALPDSASHNKTLRRELGVFDAVLLGLGSIVGTGVYVSLGFVIEMAGSATLLVIFIAGVIALCNGLSSAQLAAVHPVAGGTYEYGYQFLGPWRGRLAGWMFLIAKSASAATAALAIGMMTWAVWQDFWKLSDEFSTLGDQPIICQHTIILPGGTPINATALVEFPYGPQAITIVLVTVLGLLTHLGVKRTALANTVLVILALAPLVMFILFVGVIPAANGSERFWPSDPTPRQVGSAVALAFVAFTGYGRVATLGEEVKRPRRTIPFAVVSTLLVCIAIYAATAWASFFISGGSWDEEIDSLEYSVSFLVGLTLLWDTSDRSWLPTLLRVGAAVAMIGVVLNLILGLSRVTLAMARRDDLPKRLAVIHGHGRSPGWAVLFVTLIICGLAAVGGLKTTWTISAVTVLIYYALTNWAALKVAPEDRFVPAWVSALGLFWCLFFAPIALWELILPA